MADISNLNESWNGHSGEEVQQFVRGKLSEHETNMVKGVTVNNQEQPKDISGKVNISVPIIDDSLSTESSNAIQNAAVTQKINEVNDHTIQSVRTATVDGDPSHLDVVFSNEKGVDFASVRIPTAGEMGTLSFPKVTTELTTASRVKLGDSIGLRWTYDHVIQENGVQRSSGTPAQSVTIRALIGTTEIYNNVLTNVPAGTEETITLGADVVNRAGTVNVYVVAQTVYNEELQRAQGFKSFTVITMDLATTFDPASQLALSNGYTDGQTVTIPYNYTVPTGTTLRIWVDGGEPLTENISGTGRNYLYLDASNLSAGRHNIQMIAESSGLLSNAVSVDLLKAGSSADYLGLRISTNVSQLSDMPLPYQYGNTAFPLDAAQFDEVAFELAAWNNNSLNSTVVFTVGGSVTQTLSIDRTLHSVSQRFDNVGTQTLVVAVGNTNPTAYRTFGVDVEAASGVTETEAVGYRTKLKATGRSNGEVNPAEWGGITTFSGVDWRTNGWNKGSDGVDTLLLTNGSTALIDVQPFVQDVLDGDYSIETRGMTLEMEIMVSQVMERGATLVHCLCDNNNDGYPMGIKITTEKAGIYFGGVEEVKTADKMTDSSGNYLNFTAASVSAGTNISAMGLYVKRGLYTYLPTTDTVAQAGTTYYQSVIVSEETDAADLYILRPHGVEMDIAIDRWVQLTFVVQPKTAGGYGLAMLFVNGVLSRANRYQGSLRQSVPVGITLDSDKADVRIRSLRYYRTPLKADEVLANYIIDRPSALQIQNAHRNNAVGDSNNTADSDGNIAISRDTLLSRGRGVLTIIRSTDSGNGLTDLFTCIDKKQNFKADLVKWQPPLDANGNSIGDGFEARNVRVRIQGTSSVKYPYKNIRIYLTTEQDGTRSLSIGGVDVTATAKGYPLRGNDSIVQSVLCAKTDFVDSSLVMNTGGAHLFDSIMRALHLETPPQNYEPKVRQAIDGLPCDVYGGKSELGTLTYYGQFVLNNEKSKSGGIFGMEGIDGFSGDETLNPLSIALEALTNTSPMTLFQSAGSADSAALNTQLNNEFDIGFEFNFPEDATWANIDEGQWDDGKNKWAVKPAPGARAAIKRWMGWIYDCVPAATRTNPAYGNSLGWTPSDKAKWVSSKFKTEAKDYFDVNHLLTYYLITDYWASVDQRAKNILWRTWDGLKWFATFYDGDTAVGIRNDAFLVYLYNITRDTYDSERSKYAFEGHNSWLWCLVLANFEEELKTCAANLRNQLTTQVMLNEFNNVMQGNWSERQYNKSGKLKYIDTIQTMNYVYTLTGNRELHRTQFLTDRARLLDARYGAGNYNNDVITLTVANPDNTATLTLMSGDLYYFGWRISHQWGLSPTMVAAGDLLTMTINNGGTNDPQTITGASCIKELDLTNLGSKLNGNIMLSRCTMLSKFVLRADVGTANAPITLGDTVKLEYVDITGQISVHTGTAGVFDVSKHSRLTTFLAGGTSLTRIILPEGAPLQTLILPATLQTLTLRYLPRLTHSGLVFRGTNSITALNFAACPFLSWQTLLEQCPNIDHIRVEGLSGRVHSSVLRPFMDTEHYRGLREDGTEQTYPALIGSVELTDVIDDLESMRAFFALCGLDVREATYSEYVFDDKEIDPCNITNEDNKTGYKYRDSSATPSSHSSVTGHPFNYTRSGHIVLLHDKCVPVTGYINPSTHKMHIEALSKTNYGKLKDGVTDSDITGGSTVFVRDVFLYIPKYYYKGVNNYKEGTKHFFLSSHTTQPNSTATKTTVLQLSTLDSYVGVPFKERCSVGSAFDVNQLGTLSGQSIHTYRVSVDGYRQVRFPSMLDNDEFTVGVFVNDDGVIVDTFTLTMQSPTANPADFNGDIGDYDFRTVPAGAKYLYFYCKDTAAATSPVVVLTDSTEIEAIEPDWVEHKSELVGIFQGWVDGMPTTSGGVPNSYLRSIKGRTITRATGNATSGGAATNSGWQYNTETGDAIGSLPTTTTNGTNQDFFNLAAIRNSIQQVDKGDNKYGYSLVSYETSKDLANLLMVWFGTRDVESFVGRGTNTNSYTTGAISNSYTDTNRIATNAHNVMWGLECWTATYNEWIEKICINAPSYLEFKKNKHLNKSGWVADGYCNILQQDGTERRVKATTTNQGTNVGRVKFGRYCDIITSCYLNDTNYVTCYSAKQSHGLRMLRGGNGSYQPSSAGLIALGNSLFNNSYPASFPCGRLCFFGDIENEDTFND